MEAALMECALAEPEQSGNCSGPWHSCLEVCHELLPSKKLDSINEVKYLVPGPYAQGRRRALCSSQVLLAKAAQAAWWGGILFEVAQHTPSCHVPV